MHAPRLPTRRPGPKLIEGIGPIGGLENRSSAFWSESRSRSRPASLSPSTRILRANSASCPRSAGLNTSPGRLRLASGTMGRATTRRPASEAGCGRSTGAASSKAAGTRRIKRASRSAIADKNAPRPAGSAGPTKRTAAVPRSSSRCASSRDEGSSTSGAARASTRTSLAPASRNCRAMAAESARPAADAP